MACILYCRVSTIEQTIEHQALQARQAGFQIDEIVSDHGISGVATKLFDRPAGRRLPDLLRQGDTLVVRWLDRLGRNYLDVTEVVRGFVSKGITIKTVIANLSLEATDDPMRMAIRDAMLGFMAASAQATIEANKEAMKAGIAFTRANNPQAYKGRKVTYSADQLEIVQGLLNQGMGVSDIASATNLSRGTVYRIKNDPEAAAAALERWRA